MIYKRCSSFVGFNVKIGGLSTQLVKLRGFHYFETLVVDFKFAKLMNELGLNFCCNNVTLIGLRLQNDCCLLYIDEFDGAPAKKLIKTSHIG